VSSPGTGAASRYTSGASTVSWRRSAGALSDIVSGAGGAAQTQDPPSQQGSGFDGRESGAWWAVWWSAQSAGIAMTGAGLV